jgi:hypothetical protein
MVELVSAVRDQKELISHEAVVIVTYSECVPVLLLGYPACRPQLYIIVCGLSGFTIVLHIYREWYNFRKKVIGRKMCVLIFSTAFV